MLIDTHAHLYWNSYKPDFDQVIQRSIDAGISTIINIGVDVKTSKKALSQAKDLFIYSTIGIHPHEALQKDIEKDAEELEKIYLSNPTKIVAVGECGLDFFSTSGAGFDSSEVFAQKKLFQAQIDLAKKLNLPLIVHCREAWDNIFELIGDHPTILHCYSGQLPTTNYVLQTTNFLVSFAANITYPKNGYLREAAQLLPLEKILLETDSPFLAPQSKRGQRNEPAAVAEIAETVAEIKNVAFEKVAGQTTENAKRIFNI